MCWRLGHSSNIRIQPQHPVQIALILHPTLRVLFTLSGRLPAQNRVNGPQKRSDNVAG